MNGIGIINAQGNYDQGRGADGLGFVYASRFGISVPYSERPPAISGKPTPPASLDPNILLPQIYTGRTDYTREELLKRFPAYSGPKATTSPITWDPTPKKKPWSMLTDAEKRLRMLGFPGDVVPTVKTIKIIDPAPGKSVHLVRDLSRRRRPVSKAKRIRHRQQFIGWLKNWAPQLYAEAKKKADVAEANEGGALGNLGGWWDTFQEAVVNIGGKYLEFKTQKEILEAQLERMRAGEPPLQTSEYAPTIAIKAAPETVRQMTGAIGAGLMGMLPYIAVGGLVLVLLLRRK